MAKKLNGYPCALTVGKKMPPPPPLPLREIDIISIERIYHWNRFDWRSLSPPSPSRLTSRHLVWLILKDSDRILSAISSIFTGRMTVRNKWKSWEDGINHRTDPYLFSIVHGIRSLSISTSPGVFPFYSAPFRKLLRTEKVHCNPRNSSTSPSNEKPPGSTKNEMENC